MKHAQSNTMREQLAICQFGKSARYPVCLAALGLWRSREELSKRMMEEVSFEKVLNSAKRQKRQALELYEQFKNQEKQKETIQAAALLIKAREYLPKVQTCYDAIVGLRSFSQEANRWATVRYNHAHNAAVRTKDAKALKALQQTRKRWDALAKGALLRDSTRRELGILNLLRDKTLKATGLKAGNAAYTEAAFGGDRLLSDEVWQGRLTVREVHSHLEAAYSARVAGDKEGKEIRRTFKRLGIGWAEDRPGRKWKEPLPIAKSKQGQSRGRPRKSPEIVSISDLDAVQCMGEAAKKGKRPVGWGDIELVRQADSERDEFDLLRKEKLAEIELAQWEIEQGQAKIEREIGRLKRLQKKLGLTPARGKGIFVYE